MNPTEQTPSAPEQEQPPRKDPAAAPPAPETPAPAAPDLPKPQQPVKPVAAPAPAAPAIENRIFAIKTTSKQERTVADSILKAISTNATDIKVTAVIVPNELQGYVLVETPEKMNRIEQLVEKIPHARAVVRKGKDEGEKSSMSLSEVAHFLVPKPVVSGIEEGTIVELISGPFKGEKAVVKRVDSAKEEITVELYESVVPIPITVRGDHVRVVEKFSDQK
ncbi:MAG: Transcription elongation factor Spt5 [Methanoregula sp. PtaU1.Bin051]|nr:MAG: Transcription elongation factor Spt5 [Methanoregula sp. PtaU1.Bin051]